MYYIENLTSQVALQGNPWDFKMTEQVTEEVRKNKSLRQAFYSNPSTKHCFYSPVEPVNPNARISKKDNPPRYRDGAVADYDTLNLPPERVMEAIKLMPIKPSRIEQSLGRNWRLQFQFPTRIYTGGFDFDQFISKKMVKWLNLHILPCFDEQAFISPTRYLCNGCDWLETGHGPIPADRLQAFLVECAKEFDFKAAKEEVDIPLDVVEKALKEKYPRFNWPTSFELGSQGPSFWIEGSESPASAIVKPGGMISFAGHADKTFYSWGELLGADFAARWTEGAIAKATENIFWNGHEFYMKGVNGLFEASNKDEVISFLEVNCRLSSQTDKKTGLSPLKEALNYIYQRNKIASAGPTAMRRPGIIHRENARILNTYSRQPMAPSAGQHNFGPQGSFPFLSALFSHMLTFDSKQFWSFIAWWQYFYTGAFNWDPRPGQNLFLGGIHSSGKTLANTLLIGASVGGFMDAGEFILGLSMFNSHLYEVPHWTIDDETVIGSAANMVRTANMFKKIAANQRHMTHAKFQKQSMVDFAGRMGVTFNLDANSTRIIGPQDAATLEKTMIFRCNDQAFSGFISRDYVAQKVAEELPNFLAWLLVVKIPDCVPTHPRYGWEAYHDPVLLDHTNQSQSIAPFKELLIESLTQYTIENPEAVEWRGTLTKLMRLLAMNPLNEHVMRGLKLDQVNRYLEQIQKEGLLECKADSGKHSTRIWIFPLKLFAALAVPTVKPEPEQPTTTKTRFEK